MPDDRTARLEVRLTPKEKSDLQAMAKEVGVDVSQYIREAVFGEPEIGPEDKQAVEPSVDVSELEYQLRPQSPEHLARFPGDAKSDAQRIAFDAKVRELVKQMPEKNARIAAAAELFPRKENLIPTIAIEQSVRIANPKLSHQAVRAEVDRRVAELRKEAA